MVSSESAFDLAMIFKYLEKVLDLDFSVRVCVTRMKAGYQVLYSLSDIWEQDKQLSVQMFSKQ